MNIRPRSLPPGWYPGGKAQTIRDIEAFRRHFQKPEAKALAGIAPHAGWSFSGSIACHVLQAISGDVETIVVIGGHLAPHSGLLAASEQGYETPLGVVAADLELLEELGNSLSFKEDAYADNTVEVQLPLLKYLHPQARALHLRASPSAEALELGEQLAAAAERRNGKMAVIGSTDLTHYGDNYGFTPHGIGAGAVKWVKEVNDRRLIEALVALELEKALERADSEHSACSVGAAVAAARFAERLGAEGGELLEYRTSYDLSPSPFFVGYAGIIYPRSA
jgi:AmmeMemoRadiSam system protein B